MQATTNIQIMKTERLLLNGYLSPLIFWITTIICGFFIEGYNHAIWLISELGALGTVTRYVFTAGLLLSAILNILFIIGLIRASKAHQINLLPPIALAFYSFIAGPAIFPMPTELHSVTGIPFMLLVLSPPLSLIFWRKKQQLIKTKDAAIWSFAVMMLGFLIFFPDILGEYFGLKQRFLYLGWTIWSFALSYQFIRLK